MIKRYRPLKNKKKIREIFPSTKCANTVQKNYTHIKKPFTIRMSETKRT